MTISDRLRVDLNGIKYGDQVTGAKRSYPYAVKEGYLVPLLDISDDREYLGYYISQTDKSITVRLLGEQHD